MSPRTTIVMALVLAGVAWGQLLPPGHRARPYGVHALTGARVVVAPGEVILGATVVVRDGLIDAVGTGIAIPADARVWDLAGHTIYAGFIEPYLELSDARPAKEEARPPRGFDTEALRGAGFFGTPGDELDPGQPGPGSGNARVTPQARAADGLALDSKRREGLRELGFTAACVAPAQGIWRGTSALLSLGDEDPGQAILRADVFQHVAFERGGWGDRAYPGSLMGVFAVIRQTLLDAQHYARDHAHYQTHARDRQRPAYDPSLEALQGVVAGTQRVVVESEGILTAYRAGRIAAEMKFDLVLLGDGEEWRRPELLPRVPLLLPLRFPELPKLPDEADWDQVELDALRRWDWAPSNPALLSDAGFAIALTTHKLQGLGSFRKNLELAIARGLSEEQALAALTTVPAQLTGVADALGTIERGKIANLVVVAGDSYFDKKTKLAGVWIDGRHYPAPPEKAKDDKAGAAGEELTEPEAATAPADAATTPETEVLPPEEAAPPPVTVAAGSEPAPAAGEPAPSSEPTPATAGDETIPAAPAAEEPTREQLSARAPAAGRGPLLEPAAVLVTGATIWTCGDAGVLADAQLLVVGGRIAAIGKDLAVPEGLDLVVMDCDGQHITPGLIDCHSHSMIIGGVNEGTLPSSAMVAIGDVVNSETEHIYRQLAGGLTAANQLHGSANPIGGQNAVIKLRWGATPDGMRFAGAPAGIKFALGENVKQANWGEEFTTRFPQTRMGVRSFFDNRFQAARQYLAAWERYDSAGGAPPRRDLELECLGEILRGERLIHCHSYRQDEILMLIRLMDSYGVTIGTFQHVLEGYKVADEIAAHGAGGSCFSDWWAFKFEVYDAIPYAGTIMHQRGVVVSFNSDSSDHARRLNTEAAKAVKYGGMAEVEALKLVTLNPAKQLGIAGSVGSLEPGKDADFVLWSGSPLASSSVCLETWIDGKQYFDRSRDAARMEPLAAERAELLAKAKLAQKSGDREADDAETAVKKFETFFHVSLEHENDAGDIHCLGACSCDHRAAEWRELR